MFKDEIDRLKKVCAHEVQNLLVKYGQFTDNSPLVDLVLDLCFKFQPLIFSTKDEVEDLWEHIDKATNGVLFITELSQRLFMYYPSANREGEDFLEIFSNAAGIMHPRSANNSGGGQASDMVGIAEDQLKDLPQTNTFHKLLLANRWLVPVILLSMLNPVEVKEAYDRAVEQFMQRVEADRVRQ